MCEGAATLLYSCMHESALMHICKLHPFHPAGLNQANDSYEDHRITCFSCRVSPRPYMTIRGEEFPPTPDLLFDRGY